MNGSRQHRIRVLHISTGLDTGGAERVLERLVLRMDAGAFENIVVSLTGFGDVAEELRDKNIDVRALNMPRTFPSIDSIVKLGSVIRATKPDIIQTWMYHADILGGCVGRIVGKAPVLWNLRQTTLDPEFTRRSLLWTTRLGAKLSGFVPFTIVCGSHAARTIHEEIGYNVSNAQVIPNGHDAVQFRPDSCARERSRARLEMAEDAPVVCLPARYHPQKDHPSFVSAASLLRSRIPDVRFILLGEHVTSENDVLRQLIVEAKLEDCVHLLGRVDDPENHYPASDLVVLSSSFGEGAPNVLGEAMLCGVPCVATDIGDCAKIIGDAGRIVKPSDPHALADAMADILQMPSEERAGLGERARSRICERFGLQDMVLRYEQLYRRVASQQTSRIEFSAIA